jgi:hypothetical protein
MAPFHFVSKYFWLVAIILTLINFLMFRKRAQGHITKNPELAGGYASLFRGYLLWMNIPWVVMGIGCTVGGIPSVWHYFRPRDGDPYVLAWFGSVFFLWALGTLWVFFRDGAETLGRHPGVMEFRYGLKDKGITSPVLIKALWLLALAGGIVGVVLMWSVDIPIPTLR